MNRLRTVSRHNYEALNFYPLANSNSLSIGLLAEPLSLATFIYWLIPQATNWGYFSYFPRKQALIFHANCLHWRQFAWNVKTCFLGKMRKNISICLLKISPRVLSVKNDWIFSTGILCFRKDPMFTELLAFKVYACPLTLKAPIATIVVCFVICLWF